MTVHCPSDSHFFPRSRGKWSVGPKGAMGAARAPSVTFGDTSPVNGGGEPRAVRGDA
jgi:hypothetical protein